MQKTVVQVQREERDKKIYALYKKLVERGGMKTAVEKHIMMKFGVSGKTVYNAIQRAKRFKTRSKKEEVPG